MAVGKTFATHALSLVKRLGQRFESARRLFSIHYVVLNLWALSTFT